MRYWTTHLTPTDLTDPQTGEPLYVYAKIRPRWYWWLRSWLFFFSILWREWEPGHRLSWSVAWKVSCIVYPKGG